MKRIHVRHEIWIVAALALCLAGNARADAVTDWDAIMQATVASGNNLVQTRSAAIVQLAVFEAVNAIEGDYEPYLGTIVAPPWASPEAAAVAAAHRTLLAFYPGSSANLNLLRDQSLAAIPDSPGKDAGILVGEAAADAMLALRANDGSNIGVPYAPGTNPGEWRPTPPAFLPALLPGWGQVTTFALENGAQFRSSPPPGLRTGKYAKDYNEVKAVGALNSVFRPQDRTNVARIYNFVAGVQLWNPLARQASEAHGKTLSENARDFARLAMALADGLIAVFDTKYHYSVWRPVTAIQLGGSDGNHRTDPDPTWGPLIGTPPFPSYPSAHATSSYAARCVLEQDYGKRGLALTVSSPMVPGVILNYTDWGQITDDIDDARVYGGIHFRFDQEAGALQGGQIGKFILRNQLNSILGEDDPDDD